MATIATDQPTAAPPPDRPNRAGKGERKPLVPSWMRSFRELERKVDDALWGPVHTLLYHLMPWHNVPHVLTVLKYAPRGLWRDARDARGWVMDVEGKPLIQSTIDNEKGNDFLRLRSEHRERIPRRLILCAFVVGLLWLQLWLTQDWQPQIPWMAWWWPSSPLRWPWLLMLPWPSWLMLVAAIVRWGYRGRPAR